MKMHVKKGDTVVVISGKDTGKKGRVVGSFPEEGKIIVEGVNMITRHRKARNAQQQGGIIKQEGTIASAKVMLWCPKCDRPVRIKHHIAADDSRTRVCGRCQETLQ